MSGLGIVVENKSPIKDDILLPPLPTEETLGSNLKTFDSIVSLSIYSDIDDELVLHDVNSDNSVRSNSSGEKKLDDGIIFSNSNTSFSTYELDSPSINLDSNQLYRSPSNSSGGKSEAKNTSPLRRLRSLKNTIRKLSLSKSSTPVTTPVLGSDLAATAVMGTLPEISERPLVNPNQSHIKTLSQDSNFSKNSLESKLKSAPSTPPQSGYSSPIILSDNLKLFENNVEKLQNNYLELFHLNEEELQQNDNLANYYHFLSNKKLKIEETYQLTKSRLIKSGWCSNDDLNNLTLQKKFQLNQIDLKLLEITEKLNKQD